MLGRFTLGFTGLLAGAALAEPVVSATTPPPAESNPTAARVVWLDKQTNTRTPLVLQPGAAQTLGTLALRLERCAMNLNNQPNTDAAWLVVSEPGRGTDWFAGWMVNTLPEVATLDHPRYDVQLVGCGSQPRKKAGPVARSGQAIMGVDMETADPSETDPFYVPGLESGVSGTPVPSTPATPILNEAPPREEAVQPEVTPAAPAEAAPQQELHQMMDGVY